ncbi:MAG TPA: pitrilysin family protein, partial [Nitrospiria bacterium]
MISRLVHGTPRLHGGRPLGMGFVAVLLVFGAAFPSLAADPRKMSFPPVEFHPPKAERVALENGMVLYLLEDHELPLISLEAMIRTGSVYEPADRIGLAGLTGTVMRTGGTATISGDALDDTLEFLAVGMSSGIGQDAGYASLDLLTKDLDQALPLFAEMLMRPVFAQDKVLSAQKQTLEEIRRRNDNPSGMANRRFFSQIYGSDHPLGRESTAETVGRIVRADLVAFHAKYYRPDALILSVTGDFLKEEMINKIRSVFSGWAPGRPEVPALPPLRDAGKTEVFIVPKEISQTHLRIGHLGVRQDDPDFFALSLLDDILGGGGFRSRLFKEVRTKRGLAYSIGTAFTAGRIERGVFAAYGETKASSTHQTTAAVLEQIRKIRG